VNCHLSLTSAYNVVDLWVLCSWKLMKADTLIIACVLYVSTENDSSTNCAKRRIKTGNVGHRLHRFSVNSYISTRQKCVRFLRTTAYLYNGSGVLAIVYASVRLSVRPSLRFCLSRSAALSKRCKLRSRNLHYGCHKNSSLSCQWAFDAEIFLMFFL